MQNICLLQIKLTGACCSKIIVTGKGEVRDRHFDKLGTYELSNKISNGRKTYKLKDKEYFIHWSPENCWMVYLLFDYANIF